MKAGSVKRFMALLLTAGLLASVNVPAAEVELLPDADGNTTAGEYTFPLEETQTLTAITTFPASTESDPNNRTIFKRLEDKTNVHIEWTAIQADQWGDKKALTFANYKDLPDFIFQAGLNDTDLLKYAEQGLILNVEEYIEKDMPNLTAIFENYPEYRAMCEDADGHIWALPWIEQLGSEKTAIQTIGNMPFINTKWMDFLGLEMPGTTDEFEQVLLAFKEHASDLKKEFNIDGSIIPMSCIMNDGDQDPAILINGFGEGYGDGDRGRHIAVTDDKEVICSAVQEGYKEGIAWLHKLYEEGLIDPEAFTQEWSTYVAKGKSHRYGVLFSWDVANIDNLADYEPLPALEADVKNIPPQNGSFTSGFDRGRCVLTGMCKNPDLVCAWLDQMYDPYQSPQNNWGTYGEDDEFDIFQLGTNANGDPMLTHTPLGDWSPVEVREAESVNGPLAILNEYYGVYVTCPDDAQYRLDWIADIYTKDMTKNYVYPNLLMSPEDTEELSNLMADVTTCINTHKSDWIMNGFTDDDWNSYLSELDAYGLSSYLEIFQKYLDNYFASLGE